MSVHGVLTFERASEECGHRRALFGQEGEGPPRVLRVLADRAPYENPNGPGKAWQVGFVLPGATGRPPKGMSRPLEVVTSGHLPGALLDSWDHARLVVPPHRDDHRVPVRLGRLRADGAPSPEAGPSRRASCPGSRARAR